jgi:hypothetical protein
MANSLQQRMPWFLFFATIFNAGMLFVVITVLPDWGYGDYVKSLARAALFMAKHAMKFMVSIAMIVIFVFVVAMRERIFKVMGLDHATLFRFKLRDVFGAADVRAIQLVLYKVDDLPAAQVFAPNNVYLEMHLGYNEPAKTRVHNNAGTSCLLKETIQLNFDDNEDEEPLYIFVKNQKVVGASELGRIELKAEDVAEIERECKTKAFNGSNWNPDSFVHKRLVPRGNIYFRVEPVDDEERKGSMMC